MQITTFSTGYERATFYERQVILNNYIESQIKF